MKRKSNLRISQFNRVVHELLVSARSRVNEGTSAYRVQADINAEATKQTRRATTLAVVFLICSIFASQANDGKLFVVRLGPTELKLPIIYLTFIGSASFALLLPVSLKIISLITAKASMPFKGYARSRFVDAKLAISGEDESYDVIVPLRAGHMTKAIGGIPLLLSFAFLAMILILLLPLGGAYKMLWSVSIQSLSAESDIYLSTSLGLASLSLLCLPVLVGFLFFIPAKSVKDISSIRWNFLVHTTRNAGASHPQAKRWLKE